MFLLARPSAEQINRYLASQQDQPFSYPQVGMTRGHAPSGYQADHNRIELGRGADVYATVVAALRQWEMFDLGWVTLRPVSALIEDGRIVCVCVRHCGFWSLNGCRIVYVIDDDGPVRRFGFAYGTLGDHAESGEERFAIEWNRRDDSVCYDILAYSRPRHPLARLGYPLTRMLQKRFARDSKAAMRRAAEDGMSPGDGTTDKHR